MIAQRTRRIGWMLAASGLFLGVTAAPSLRGDEPPSRLGRLFRMPGASKAGNAPPVGKGAATPSYGEPVGKLSAATSRPGATAFSPPLSSFPPTPSAATGAAGSRLVPQPRVSRSVTESDPLVSRISIGRADDGKQFCMFIQVFADGTVLDSEGVHKVGAESLRPIAQVISSGELAKLRGHCGGPASDFIEQVHVVAYDRYLGRLRANSFSHSGNPQGCDPSVKELNAAIDALQAKLAGPATASPASPSPHAEAMPIGISPGA